MTARVKHYRSLEDLLRDARRLAVEVKDTLKNVDRFKRLLSLASAHTAVISSPVEDIVRQVALSAKTPARQPAKTAPAAKRPPTSAKRSAQLPVKAPPSRVKLPVRTPATPAAAPPSPPGRNRIKTVVRQDRVEDQEDDIQLPQEEDFHLLKSAIGQNFQAFADLRRQKIELGNMLAQLRSDFADEPKAQIHIKGLEDLRTVIDRKLVDARKVMQALAQERMPPLFRRVANKIQEHVETVIGSSYETSTNELMVSPVGDEIHYVSYLHLTDFTNEHEVVSPDYYVILTLRVLDDGSRSMHLTTLYDHQMPGLYRLGPVVPISENHPGAVTVKAAIRILEEKLHMDKFDDVLSPLPLPVSGENFHGVDTGIKGVHSISMHHDKLYRILVELDASVVKKADLKDKKAEVAQWIRRTIRKIDPQWKDVLRLSTTQGGPKTGLWTFEVFFTPNDAYTGKHLDAFEYERLAEMFGMTPLDVNRLRRALEKQA